MIKETLTKKLMKLDFDRELIVLKDGGTCAVYWNVDSSGAGRPIIGDEKPILLLYPGISGCHKNLYTLLLAWEAWKHGFVCGSMVFQGAEVDDLPVTGQRVNSAVAWDDATHMTNYVHEKYCMHNKQKTRNLYAYGVSLGAQLLANQLGEEGKNSKYDGAILYAVPWNFEQSWPFVLKYGGGFYGWAVGQAANLVVKEAMTKMKGNLKAEVFERYMAVLKSNWEGLAPVEDHVIAPMYGFKDRLAYNKVANVVQRISKIMVPTFALHAKDDWVCNE